MSKSKSPSPSPRSGTSSPSLSSSSCYPLPAYLNFCPGGVTYASSSEAENAYYYLSECVSPSIGTPTGTDSRRGTPIAGRSASRQVQQQRPTSVPQSKSLDGSATPSLDSLVYKAKLADDTLRQHALLSSSGMHDTPYFLPSLSVLAEAAFSRLTGVPHYSVKAWADAMVLHYWEEEEEETANNSESDRNGKPGAMKIVTETTATALRRILEKQEKEKDRVAASPLSRSRPCGYVFKRGDIAWNCRTCQADSTCVICDSCFRYSNHDGHEVYFHRTVPGGCCDCGDPEAWKSEGCCDSHRPAVDTKVGESRGDDPEEAIRMAQKSLKESEAGLSSGPTALPPKMAAALGVVIGAAVKCLLQAADGAGIGADPVQWKVRWSDEASHLQNRVCHNEDYIFQQNLSSSSTTPNSFLNAVMPETLPSGYRLHLRLHNDDVHTFEEVIDALHEPRQSRRGTNRDEEQDAPPLVPLRDAATDMTHHVDADGQVTVKSYSTIAAAMQGFRRLKSHGLHCAVVGSSQVDQEQRAKVLSSWLSEISAAHPVAASLVVHALVKVDPRHNLGPVSVWHEARMIPPWAALDTPDEAQACRRRFQAFPPHLASSYLTREEAEMLYDMSLKVNADAFVQQTGTINAFYSKVPYRLQPERYRKSPHALWGTLPSAYTDPIPIPSKHPLLYLLHHGEFDANVQNRLTEGVSVIDTDLRKQQEADRITSSVFPHKLPGLHLISGVGTRSANRISPESPALPNPMQWRHLLGTSSFRAPASPCLLLLLLDPYPTKQFRSSIHALFLSLLTDARFKCRFAAALGVAYRPLSTLFCAGVGTEADSPLGFTVQIFTAGSLVRALGSATVAEQLLNSDFGQRADENESSIGVSTSPLAHSIVRCIHTNILGATKEVNMILNNTKAGDDNDSQDEADLGNGGLLRALTYVAGEHPLMTPLPAAPDDGFLDSRSTRHKRLPHLLRDLEYVIETPGTALRLLLPLRYPLYLGPSESSRGITVQTFAAVFARLLRVAQGMDPQKRKISGGHVEYEQNRWLEAFGLSLNFAGTRDALAESLVNTTLNQGMDNRSRLGTTREAMGNMLAALLREIKLWLYREGMLETGLPLPPGGTHGGVDLSQVEALQRSTLHVSGVQVGLAPLSGGPKDSTSVAANVNTVALSCATGVKMTEAQLNLIESALRVESAQHNQVKARNLSSPQAAMKCPLLGDWLRVPHSPLAGDSLSFHLPLHRALAKTVRSMCGIVVPEAVRNSPGQEWWKLPVLDETSTVPGSDAHAAPYNHPLVSVLRPTLRSSNCRVVWSAGPDCSPQEAQHRRARSRTVSANIAVAKIIHSLADHPIRCLAASQQIERHLWARNGSATAGMALNYSSTPLCQRFRDLDLTLVQLSAAGLSVGLGARKVFSLLMSRFSMDGYLCDPERRAQIGSSSPSGGNYGSGASQWVNPPRMQDPDHAVVLSESFFSTLCMLVTELPPPPPVTEKDDTWLRHSIRRELVHALVAEPRSHSEAMAAASCAVSRRDESDGTALSSGGGSLFREAFTDVLQEIGKQKSQGSSRVSSGPPAFELKSKFCDEYDPTFFHLRRQEHQHAMDVVARLRKAKNGDDEAGEAFCLPLVCAPPRSHPRFLPCRLLLHLQGMDAALRRALLFALTGGSWLPPSEPENESPFEEVSALNPEQLSGTEGIALTKQTDVSAVAFGARRVVSTQSSSSFKRSSSGHDAGQPPPFSPDVVAASSVSFLEVLQLLTLQVHTLEECASLHHTIPDLDDEAKVFSSGLSINSYLGRLVYVPDSLVGIWAFKPYPVGPLTSSGSGANRGSILGLLIALYEHRSDHGAILDSNGGKEYGQGDSEHGGARALASSGLKWLLRFVNALVDGAHSVGVAVKSATTGVPVGIHRSSPSMSDSNSSWTIDEKIRSTISGMLSGLPELWPAPRVQGSSSGSKAASDKGKEARKAAQERVLAMMKKKQAAFAATITPASGQGNMMDDAEDEEADLCIICRCDDTYGENNGPLGYLGHVQRSRVAQMRAMREASSRGNDSSNGLPLLQKFRVVGHMGCQLRESEAMDSKPLSCLPRGSIVTVLKVLMLDKYDILSRRVLVQHVPPSGVVTEGWASMQSSQGYVILSPLASVCYTNSRWGGTRPIIRQCGHAAHLKCVEAHTLSLHQRAAGEQPYDGRFAANIDDGEFLCPLCKQLSNILIPRDSFVGGTSVPEKKTGEDFMQDTDANQPSNAVPPDSMVPILSLHEKISMGQLKCRTKRLTDMGKDALKDFGAHLFQAMDVPWERQLGWRSQNQLHPAILRWDYEEEDDVDEGNKDIDALPKEAPHGKSSLRLLRQQHIAWAALGHSAAGLEASTRGLEEVLPFGTMISTADPWSDFSEKEKDTHPMLLELKRTIAGVSGLYEVLIDEVSSELGFDSSESKIASVVGALLADIFDGNSWFNKDHKEQDNSLLWSELTCLMSSIPCHVARDGQISKRSEARASAAAMWTVKGLGSQRKKISDPPAPLSISKVVSKLNKWQAAEIMPGWGTLDPRGCVSGDAHKKVPFRPAVASAFLYTPLLAWDLNTFAGALFSAILVNDVAALPTSRELLHIAQSLIVSRMIQAIITPGGIVAGNEMDVDEDSMSWPLEDIQREGAALSQLANQCRNRVKEVALPRSKFLDEVKDIGPSLLFASVGEALLPLSRSIILLLRSCSAVIRERKRLSQVEPEAANEFDRRLDSIMYNADIMSSDDGFELYKAFDGPLPSLIVQQSDPWWDKIDRWLVATSVWEAHHGSNGRSIEAENEGDPAMETAASAEPNGGNNVKMLASASAEMNNHLGDDNGAMEDMNESDYDDDDEIVEGMELENDIPVVGLPDTVAGNDAPSARGQAGNQFRSEDSSEDNSLKDDLGDSDREFAYVSRSPIISHQPSLLGLVGIGAVREGTFFESESANLVMSDHSHLGLRHSREFPTFSLVRLPSSFVELYSIVNKVKGRDETNLADESDDVSTSETAICLVSGTVLRSGSTRRSFSTRAARPPGACTLHARKTGSGIGIFFLVQKCTVLLMHNNKSAYSASLYVDEHGEEDPGLRRGRPLFLNKARYKALELLWRQQGIPREVAQIRSTSDRVIRDNWY